MHTDHGCQVSRRVDTLTTEYWRDSIRPKHASYEYIHTHDTIAHRSSRHASLCDPNSPGCSIYTMDDGCQAVSLKEKTYARSPAFRAVACRTSTGGELLVM